MTPDPLPVALPELPEPFDRLIGHENEGAHVFTADQMRAFAEAALRAQAEEVAALRADAERYRWLRVQPNDTSAPRIDVVRWTAADDSANDGEGLRTDALDAAIDAHLAASKQEKP